MKVLGLDPGTTKSAIVLYDTESKRVGASFIGDNLEIKQALEGCGLRDELSFVRRNRIGSDCSCLVIEQIEAMGMSVGKEIFETVFWTGRFYEAWPWKVERVTRRQVKLALCGSMKAKDPNIRQALIDKLGAPGTKSMHGATYGVSSHSWAALAVAVTWAESVGL